MDFLIIGIASVIASGLTLISGFGLGTLLMPVFALFFPIDLAIALTAIVHLLNNIFKLFLLGKHADIKTVMLFGIPGIFAAFLGAWVLLQLTHSQVLYQYELWGGIREITTINLIIAVLMIIFALFEILPALQKITLERKYLPAGGLLSGFFRRIVRPSGCSQKCISIKSGFKQRRIYSNWRCNCLCN